jgi:HK97 gp10 family phage protein
LSLSVSVQIDGVEELADALQDFNESIHENVQEQLEDVAQQIVLSAKQYAPIRTGLLVSSISAIVLAQWAVQIICDVGYAIYQEFGTSRIAPRYFITQALNENLSSILDAVAVGVAAAVNEFGG